MYHDMINLVLQRVADYWGLGTVLIGMFLDQICEFDTSVHNHEYGAREEVI